MKIRIADFEILTRNYKVFVDGKTKINERKDFFLKKIEPLRKDMESIIKSANSSLIVDQSSQQQRMERFKQLQEEAMRYDNEFKQEFKKMNDELTLNVYNDLEKIISEWAEKNDIDLVTGKMEVVFVKPEFNVTDQILEVLKEKDLYIEYKETEKEKESV